MGKRFIVSIIETLKLDVGIIAESEDDAIQIVTDGYNDCQYVLSADNFCEVEFLAMPAKDE